MQVCIDAVREAGKVAEVAICYTSDFTTNSIYTLEYYKDLAVSIAPALLFYCTLVLFVSKRPV
eukprot:SAG11_NODE_19757_length_459_cov_1.188889_1_plen_63_part_00